MSHCFTKAFLFALVAFFTALVVPARADTTLYSTSFENPPFAMGDIAGQNGWQTYGNGISVVQNDFAFTGSQAVFVNGNDTQSGPYYVLNSSGPLIRESAEIAIFSSTNESGWQFAATAPGLIGYMGGIDIDPTTNAIHAITAGFPVIGTFTRATTFDNTAWNNISFLFNLTTQTYSITINGVTLDSNVPFCGNNTTCNSAVLSTYGDGFFDTLGKSGANDSAYMDDYSVSLVSGVPEPTSARLILVALTAGSAIALRRKLFRKT